MDNNIWEVAIAVSGLGGVAAFVFLSLYKGWLKLKIFAQLTKNQTFSLMKLFLLLSFAFALFSICVYAYLQINMPSKMETRANNAIFIEGEIFSQDKYLIIDLNRVSPNSISRIKSIIEYAADDTQQKFDTRKLNFIAELKQFESLSDNAKLNANKPTGSPLDRYFMLRMISRVEYLHTSRVVKISFKPEFNYDDITEVISEISNFQIMIPDDEYVKEKRALILDKLSIDNESRKTGRIKSPIITIGNLLALNFG